MPVPKGKRRLAFGTKILFGVLLGIAFGILFGELPINEWLGVAGKVYVGLLQMTVLPYVVVSLITKIGGLTMDQAARLGGRAGIVMLVLWAISLVTVAVLPLSLPEWKAGSFFSASLIEQPAQVDFIELYVPENPFFSLANNIVPAAVLFSIFIGVALIGLEHKDRILKPAVVTGDALSWVGGLVVKLSPYGTFALTAHAAGTLAPAELTRLAGYVSTYTVGVVLLTFLVLPAFVSAITPFRLKQLLFGYREAGLTAFATGKLFAVLPMVIKSAKDLLMERDVPEEEAATAADVFVPLGYPFPNAGKVLSLLFIPFAAWFVGRPLAMSDYPMMLTIGLLSFFGSPVAAIPFMLDMLRLPQDVFPLFLVAGIWCARLGDMLGAMHLSCFTLLNSAWERGWLKVRGAGLLRWAGLSAGALVLGLVGNRFLVRAAIADQPPSKSLVEQLDLRDQVLAPDRIEVREEGVDYELKPGEDRWERIERDKAIRVGYIRNRPPFCYRNGENKLVGFDIDLIQRLVAEVEIMENRKLKLVLVPYERGKLIEGFRRDHFDLAVGAIPSTIFHFDKYRQSGPYLSMHAALIVRDHLVRELRKRRPRRIGYSETGYLAETNRHRLKDVDLVKVSSKEAFLRGEYPDVEALLTTAEAGAVLTMLYPDYSLIPLKEQVLVPIVIAMQPDTRYAERVLDTWIELKREDGTIERLYDHWILGKSATRKPPRWSLVQDVFGWFR